MDEKTIARFWSKVDKVNGPTHPVHGKCWTWTGGGNGCGYGAIAWNGRRHGLAHRLSLIIAGRLGDSSPLHVLHKCDNPPCVRPDHLFVGTARDNSIDAARKGRAPTQKLSASQAADILSRRRGNGDIPRIAEEFGVSRSAVSLLLYGFNWRHLAVAGAGCAEGKRLTREDVVAILADVRALTQGEVAAKYGVSQATVSDIVCGRTWKHVTSGRDYDPRPSRVQGPDPEKLKTGPRGGDVEI